MGRGCRLCRSRLLRVALHREICRGIGEGWGIGRIRGGRCGVVSDAFISCHHHSSMCYKATHELVFSQVLRRLPLIIAILQPWWQYQVWIPLLPPLLWRPRRISQPSQACRCQQAHKRYLSCRHDGWCVLAKLSFGRSVDEASHMCCRREERERESYVMSSEGHAGINKRVAEVVALDLHLHRSANIVTCRSPPTL